MAKKKLLESIVDFIDKPAKEIKKIKRKKQFDKRMKDLKSKDQKSIKSKEKRDECGRLGHEFVMSDDASMSATAMSNLFIEHMDTAFDKWTPRKRFTMHKV